MSKILQPLVCVAKTNSHTDFPRRNHPRSGITRLSVEQLEGRLMLSDIIQPIVDGTAQIEASEPIGQTFIAEDASIQSIGFKIVAMNGWMFPNNPVTASLYEGTGTGGVLLHSETLTLPDEPNPNEFTDFDFSSVTLTPGAVYSVVLDTTNARWGVQNYSTTSIDGVPIDRYDGGERIFENQPVGGDMGFRVLVPRKVVSGIAIDTVTNGSDGAEILVDTLVTWTYSVTNTGNGPLWNVRVRDDQGFHAGLSGGDNGNLLLDVGETWIFTALGTAEFGAHENVGKVTAEDARTYDVVSASDPTGYFGFYEDSNLSLRQLDFVLGSDRETVFGEVVLNNITSGRRGPDPLPVLIRDVDVLVEYSLTNPGPNAKWATLHVISTNLNPTMPLNLLSSATLAFAADVDQSIPDGAYLRVTVIVDVAGVKEHFETNRVQLAEEATKAFYAAYAEDLTDEQGVSDELLFLIARVTRKSRGSA
jgi:hypothetical protein